jgi:hypothetical protein
LGGLGAAGMLRGRFGGSQPVSGGAVGFAFGGALGLLVTLAYVVLRSRARPNGFVVTLVALAGTVAVVGLFVALTH